LNYDLYLLFENQKLFHHILSALSLNVFCGGAFFGEVDYLVCCGKM